MVGVERQVPRLHSPFLEGRWRRGVGVCHAHLRLERFVRVEQSPAARQHQFHHRARRLHADDLVSYDHKHNEANGEDNRDGSNDNISWNCGVEGETEDPAIRSLRERKKRSFLATLVLSQGVPMMLAGDEMGHTQHGNNNAYCQDNEISWLNWELTPDRESLLKFVRRVVALFHEQPVFHRRRFFHGKPIQGSDTPDIVWLEPSGVPMGNDAWNASEVRCLGVELFGGNIDVDEHGETIRGDTLLLLFNADHGHAIPFVLPKPDGEPWVLEFDTAKDGEEGTLADAKQYVLEPCSMVVLRSQKIVAETESIL